MSSFNNVNSAYACYHLGDELPRVVAFDCPPYLRIKRQAPCVSREKLGSSVGGGGLRGTVVRLSLPPRPPRPLAVDLDPSLTLSVALSLSLSVCSLSSLSLAVLSVGVPTVAAALSPPFPGPFGCTVLLLFP